MVNKTSSLLRKKSTQTEIKFWQAVRNRKLDGKRIVRQHAIRFEFEERKRFFVADFYCFESKLVIEIDGGIHEMQKDYDTVRTHIINYFGIKVIRFTNEQVLNELAWVLHELRKELTQELTL